MALEPRGCKSIRQSWPEVRLIAFLPRIGAASIVLAAATISDQLVLFLSVRSIKRKESTMIPAPQDISLEPMLDSPVQMKQPKEKDASGNTSFSVYVEAEQEQQWQSLPFLASKRD